MHPVLLTFALFGRELELPAYTSFIALGGLAVLVIGTITASRRGLSGRASLICLLSALVVELVGARLTHRLVNPAYYAEHPGMLYTLDRVGLSVYGGLILAALTVPIICRAARLNLWSFADSVAPALGIGIALARIGCFLNGCCYGVPTSLPWGVAYPMGSPAYFHQVTVHGIGLLSAPRPVHPTQIYEAVAALLCAGLAAWMVRRGRANGMAFCVFIALFTAVRWVNYPLLADKDPSGALLLYPALYATVILACGAIAFRRVAGIRDHSADLTSDRG